MLRRHPSSVQIMDANQPNSSRVRNATALVLLTVVLWWRSSSFAQPTGLPISATGRTDGFGANRTRSDPTVSIRRISPAEMALLRPKLQVLSTSQVSYVQEQSFRYTLPDGKVRVIVSAVLRDNGPHYALYEGPESGPFAIFVDHGWPVVNVRALSILDINGDSRADVIVLLRMRDTMSIPQSTFNVARLFVRSSEGNLDLDWRLTSAANQPTFPGTIRAACEQLQKKPVGVVPSGISSTHEYVMSSSFNDGEKLHVTRCRGTAAMDRYESQEGKCAKWRFTALECAGSSEADGLHSLEIITLDSMANRRDGDSASMCRAPADSVWRVEPGNLRGLSTCEGDVDVKSHHGIEDLSISCEWACRSPSNCSGHGFYKFTSVKP